MTDAQIREWAERMLGEMHAYGKSRDDIESAARLQSLEQELERLRRALEAIKDAPGGGPGKRIATMALESARRTSGDERG